MIRPATPADVPAIVALGHQMLLEAPRWRDMEYAPGKVELLAGHLIAGGGLFVADHAGALVGMLGGLALEHWFSTTKIAQPMVVYVAPAHRGGRAFLGLMRAFEGWAAAQGVQEILLGAHTGAGDADAAALFARLGYLPSGCNLWKPVG